jgi:exopolysaccharide biosynthesis WecB/TagA/CpsF family protein
VDIAVSFPSDAGARVRVDTPCAAALIGKIEADLRRGASFAVATLNLDHLVKLRRSAAFRDAYMRQTHVVADGHPVVWLSHLAARPVSLAPGSELIDPLCALAARLEAPVALLGSTPEALKRTAQRLAARHPGLVVAAQIAPPFGFDPEGPEADACLDALARSGARLCFVALGAPKQEIFAARGAERIRGCGFVSVGAGLDFIAGSQRRAPIWIRKIAMEWFWRMLSDPRRLARRYLDCALILPSLVRDGLRQRRGEHRVSVRDRPGRGIVLDDAIAHAPQGGSPR